MEAMHMKLFGAPFGPAGTGKTESVKALAKNLGEICLVFNCDETFQTNEVLRILKGLCALGAWGCFDEFNRLEVQTLSAISQIITDIQTELRNDSRSLLFPEQEGASKLDPRVGLFITMNPT